MKPTNLLLLASLAAACSSRPVTADVVSDVSATPDTAQAPADAASDATTDATTDTADASSEPVDAARDANPDAPPTARFTTIGEGSHFDGVSVAPGAIAWAARNTTHTVVWFARVEPDGTIGTPVMVDQAPAGIGLTFGQRALGATAGGFVLSLRRAQSGVISFEARALDPNGAPLRTLSPAPCGGGVSIGFAAPVVLGAADSNTVEIACVDDSDYGGGAPTPLQLSLTRYDARGDTAGEARTLSVPGREVFSFAAVGRTADTTVLAYVTGTATESFLALRPVTASGLGEGTRSPITYRDGASPETRVLTASQPAPDGAFSVLLGYGRSFTVLQVHSFDRSLARTSVWGDGDGAFGASGDVLPSGYAAWRGNGGIGLRPGTAVACDVRLADMAVAEHISLGVASDRVLIAHTGVPAGATTPELRVGLFPAAACP